VGVGVGVVGWLLCIGDEMDFAGGAVRDEGLFWSDEESRVGAGVGGVGSVCSSVSVGHDGGRIETGRLNPLPVRQFKARTTRSMT
jgi:hypothetical protein